MFHFFVSLRHHFRCDPALSVFASKCLGECHAVKAALCDLGDPGWGIPGFRIELCCFPPSEVAHCDFVVGLIVVLFYEPASTWHTSCH